MQSDADDDRTRTTGARRFYGNLRVCLRRMRRQDRRVKLAWNYWAREAEIAASTPLRWKDKKGPGNLDLKTALRIVAAIGIPLTDAVRGVEPFYDTKVRERLLAAEVKRFEHKNNANGTSRASESGLHSLSGDSVLAPGPQGETETMGDPRRAALATFVREMPDGALDDAYLKLSGVYTDWTRRGLPQTGTTEPPT